MNVTDMKGLLGENTGAKEVGVRSRNEMSPSH